MYYYYETLLLKRFLFSKKTDGYISIFTWFSIIGTMIGVSAIIVVMSVMNGFREELISKLLGMNGHISIFSSTNQIKQNTINEIEKLETNSIDILPLIQTQALLISEKNSKGVYIRSYSSEDLKRKISLKFNIVKGDFYKESSNEIIIGSVLSRKLNLDLYDKVKLAIPKSDKTIFGNIPRFKTLEVAGIFDTGMYDYDENLIFLDLKISRKLLLLDENNFNQIEVKINDLSDLENQNIIINKLLKKFNTNLYTVTWKENNQALINALKVEKNVMFLILLLIIIVASMNIISGMIIYVNEKNKDIGILKTIGISDASLIKIFTSLGLIIGFIGTFSGAILGIVLSTNINSIQNFLEKLLNMDLFSKEIYYLSSLPSKLQIHEVILVSSISMIICLIAAIFPAYRSSKIDPIKTIKND